MQALGVDPDALAAEVDLRYDAATDALDARESHARRQGLSSERTAALIAEAAAWTTTTRRTLRVLRPQAPAAIDELLKLLPTRVREFKPTPAVLREAVRALTTTRAAFGDQPLFTRLLDGATDLLARVEAHERVLAEQAAVRRTTVDARTAERLALLDTLRLVRRAWKAAQTVNPRIGELDLRLAKAAAWHARRADPAATPPDAPPTEASPAPPPTDVATPSVGAPPTEASPAPSPTDVATPSVGDPPAALPHAAACESPTLVLRRLEQVEVYAHADRDEG